MSTPPPSNILTDPVAELTEAIRTNLFGLDPTSTVLLEQSFPITAEDKEAIRVESLKKQSTSERVVGKARVVLLEGDGLEITLDQRGYTVSPVPLGRRLEKARITEAWWVYSRPGSYGVMVIVGLSGQLESC